MYMHSNIELFISTLHYIIVHYCQNPNLCLILAKEDGRVTGRVKAETGGESGTDKNQ
jgi:hypothetical protein